jgi:spoIIIJ-associated protein
MTDGTLFTGKSVEDAVADGLRSLGLTQEQAEIEVISRGSRGLFGIGSEPAQVRITPRASKGPSMGAATPPARETPAATSQPAPAAVSTPAQPPATAAYSEPPAVEKSPEKSPIQEPTGAPTQTSAQASATASASDADTADEAEAQEPGASHGTDDEADDAEMAALAVELLSETVQMMGFEADVVATWQEPDADNDERYLLLNLHGRDLGALIGRRGETLGNLQYLLRLMVNQRLHQWKNIVVDVEQYRQHRAEHLMQLALRSADQVAKSGRPLSLEPMPPNERRIIHLALRDNTSVYTESSGDGERRKIQILPRRSS